MQYEQVTIRQSGCAAQAVDRHRHGAGAVGGLLQGKHDNYDIDLFRALIAASSI
jgi:alanyl-tRNA synthetase